MMKISQLLLAFFFIQITLFTLACKKQGTLVITLDKDTIFVKDQIRFNVDLDFKVKEEEWKVIETNTSFSNTTAATYEFPAKGIYTVEYTAKYGINKKIRVLKTVVVYALPGIIKNYWADASTIHADISFWVKGTRYDGKYYEDSIYYENKNGIAIFKDCEDVYEPKVFLNIPGGRYKCFLKYKYYYLGTIWVEHADSVFVDGNCQSFNF